MFIVFGMIFVILIGGIDLLVGFILVLLSVFVVGMMVSGMDLFFVMVVGLLVGFVMGIVNGIIIVKGKVVLFIVILVIMIIFCGLMFVYMDGCLIIGFGDYLMF